MRFGLHRLLMTFMVAVIAWIAVQTFGQSHRPHPKRDVMLAAVQRTERAFAVVDSVKRARGYAYPEQSSVPWRTMMGEDYTAITTTLGSLTAKEVSTNPAWASLLVRMLVDNGVVSGDTVAVLASGSFPALTLATVSAVIELDAAPLVISSLGASSYGANVQQATWIDMEQWVRDAGVMDLRSAMVTAGGTKDVAAALSDEGRQWFADAARRNDVDLIHVISDQEMIAVRMDRLSQQRLAAIVNIGGGQAALGTCPHAASLPTGSWNDFNSCRCSGRGVLGRASEQGIPVIHLLNIRQLAAYNGLDFEPGSQYKNAGTITIVTRPHVLWILVALFTICLSLVVPRRNES